MGFFSDAVRGLAQDTRPGRASSLLRRLCAANGWGIDKVDGKRIELYFNGDDIISRRIVHVIHGEGEGAMTFFAVCSAFFPASAVPDGLLPGLLARNNRVPIGAWGADVDPDNDVSITLQHRQFTVGLTAAQFKLICSKLVGEVAALERELRERGYL